MSWTFLLRPREMESFRCCRRAWDLGARVRQNYVPIVPSKVFDFEKAVHDALAVYYFPAMGDWDRSIVRPLAIQGFHRSMRQDRENYEKLIPLTAEQDREWNDHVALGDRIIKHYLAWAAEVDDFDSILADQEFWVYIPDPWSPGKELATPQGRPVRYFGRIGQLISDPDDEYWLVDHRIVKDDWEDTGLLMLDMMGASFLWALQISYPQLRLAGIIYNELRSDGYSLTTEPPLTFSINENYRQSMQGARHINLRRSALSPTDELLSDSAIDIDDCDEIVHQEGNDKFRRTYIRRSQKSIKNAGLRVALEAQEVLEPELRIYPNPSRSNCSACDYQKPCLAISSGLDPEPVLAAHYRTRTEKEELDEECLRWSAGRQGIPPALSGKVLRPSKTRSPWS